MVSENKRGEQEVLCCLTGLDEICFSFSCHYAGETTESLAKKARLGKNPEVCGGLCIVGFFSLFRSPDFHFSLFQLPCCQVDTSFLPDKQREEQEKLRREELRREWVAKQVSWAAVVRNSLALAVFISFSSSSSCAGDYEAGAH